MKQPQKYTDRELMLRAIEISKQCISESGKQSPKVGAVIARDGVLLGEAYRGELAEGEHAEFTLLEKKLSAETLAGSTLFTTLEPCTSRNHPKISCADRVIERRIGNVVIGTLDRNPKIRGKGELRLIDAGIKIQRFDADLIPVIEEMNRDFLRQYIKGRRFNRTKAETTDPIKPDLVGPNGFQITFTEKGDKIELIPDNANPNEFFALILRRNDNDILEMYNELRDKIWWNRHQSLMSRIANGEKIEMPKRGIDAAKRIEKKYGLDSLIVDEVEYLIMQGRMSALSWVLGSEWEGSMDT